MPVLTRFILPKDYDKRFQRLGRRYCCDITTTWTKRGDCYVPARVQSMIENYTTAGSFRSTLEVTTEYFWKSKLCTNKGIDPSVFTPKKIPSETLFESFDLVGSSCRYDDLVALVLRDVYPQPLIDLLPDDHQSSIIKVLVVNLSKAGPSVSGEIGPGVLIF